MTRGLLTSTRRWRWIPPLHSLTCVSACLMFFRVGCRTACRISTQPNVFESRLPAKERNLLDVYAEIWLKQNFDVALAKMKTLVDAYPDDKESKSVYALLRWELVKDTAGAIQLFHDVLKQDPKYQLALGFLVQCYQGLKDYDKAIEYSKRLQQYHPESPAASRILGGLYALQSRFGEAIAAYNDVLRQYPGDPEALMSLVHCYVSQRDFATADRYLEEYRKAHEGDAFRMGDYYQWKANLANWSGKFKTSMGYRFSVLTQAYETKDSLRVISALHSISQYYQAYGLLDSAAYYHMKSLPWSTQFQRLNYAVGLVSIDRSYANDVRTLQRDAIALLRTRVP
ncbi:MAG: tetratricopeptide repeat protein [Candidatus Zixiibacteriota bacterium]|nr:MAG: tetratricopeptide repeat protein [candidate division Zixibacteria bacterium]